MKLFKVLISAATAVMLATAATASVVNISGAGQQIAQPGNVTNLAPGSNTHILVFDELQNYLLLSTLFIDGGSIASGTRIDSHMVFLNRATGTSTLSLTATFTFGGTIIGTMSSLDGALQDASDYLGAPTIYDNFDNRGLESNDSFSIAGSAYTANFLVSQPGDWVRVVTVAAVPLPAAGLLLMGALGGLGFVARRRRKAA